MSLSAALDLLGAAPPIEQLVVCHGDACAPNALIDSSGQWSAHVDLGALGIADRWADLAVATWSTQWNYGTGWEGYLTHTAFNRIRSAPPTTGCYGIWADDRPVIHLLAAQRPDPGTEFIRMGR